MADRIGVINKWVRSSLVEDKAGLMQKLGKKELKKLQGRIVRSPPRSPPTISNCRKMATP